MDDDFEYRKTNADKPRPRSAVDNTVSLLRNRGVRERWEHTPGVPDYLREALEELEALHLEERALVEACVD
ncbi:hypothetical protein [Rhodococcus sp. 1168]|uniref:hypothetical protein n=1 Tax=Rhodococcus sp. 1168 TaxID=2018041 RepID=UPI000A0D8E8B|nr:hypothetical protein [Rhodococcus sp. 1168]ORI14803.1 hypothetical protein BJI47_00875 [Rhodococcus sp. 1168]